MGMREEARPGRRRRLFAAASALAFAAGALACLTARSISGAGHVALRAAADAGSVFDGAPPLIQNVLASAKAGAADQPAGAPSEAQEEYQDALEGYERLEEGMAPREPAEARSQMEMDASQQRHAELEQQLKALRQEWADATPAVARRAQQDRAALARRFQAPGAQQQLSKLPPEVLTQMAEDVEHPPEEERAMEHAIAGAAAPGKDKAIISGLEKKVKKLQALNAQLALHKPPPGDHAPDAVALKHAEAVAAKAADEEEKKTLAATTSLLPATALSPALAHAEAIAHAAAAAEVKQAEAKTRKFLAKKVKVDKLKMLGVKEDHIGGVRHALAAGQDTAKKIPGVKEDTWPFGPGSWRFSRKKPLPGVNEASWEVLPDFDGPHKAEQGFKAHAGGCFPDKTGRLRCHGEQEAWMNKAGKGWDKRRSVPKTAPGTGLATLLPHIREDAEQQKLDAAAAAFGTAMAPRDEGTAGGRVQELEEVQDAKRKVKAARMQALEQVAKQCSNLLDCLAMQTSVVPRYTHPTLGAGQDRMVATADQSLSHTAMHDAFNPALRPWRLISKWPFESGDVQVKMPATFVGKISRPAVGKRHGKAHMAFDVPAAELPSDRMTSMYARERSALRSQALAAEKAGTLPSLMSLWEKPEHGNQQVKPGARGLGVRNYENTAGLCTAGVNCDSSNWPFGERDSMSDALVDAKEVQDWGLGAAGPWTPMMYTGNKPTSYDPGAAYQPDYELLAQRPLLEPTAQMHQQMLRLNSLAPPSPEIASPAREERVDWEEDLGGEPEACPVCEECAEGDEECDEAHEECVTAAADCQAALPEDSCGDCEEGDAECEARKEACEAEAACLEGDNECIAAARGTLWSPMTGHVEDNGKEFVDIARPQHHGAHTWRLPGVNVDSGWMPYKHADVWGYDRRSTASSPDPEIGSGDEAASEDRGLLSAARALPKDEWNAWDKIEHSNHVRALDSVQAAWHSVAGGESSAPQDRAGLDADAAAAEEEAGEEGDIEDDGEDGVDEDGEVMNEKDSVTAKVKRMRKAPSLHAEGTSAAAEREAMAERAHAAAEQQHLEQYLHSHFGARKGGGKRRLLGAQEDPNVEPKDDDTLNVKFPARPTPPKADGDVLPRRARGRGRHAKTRDRSHLAKGGYVRPDTQKMVTDLRKVRSEADKLGEGPWSLTRGVDKVVRAAVRHAGDDIRSLVRMGQVHPRGVAKGKVRGGQTWLAAARGKNAGGHAVVTTMESGAAALHSQMADLNALTRDVDEVTDKDDVADMRGVDKKLHQLVDGMRQRGAGPP